MICYKHLFCAVYVHSDMCTCIPVHGKLRQYIGMGTRPKVLFPKTAVDAFEYLDILECIRTRAAGMNDQDLSSSNHPAWVEGRIPPASSSTQPGTFKPKGVGGNGDSGSHHTG